MSDPKVVQAYAKALIGCPYKLGEEFWYIVGPEGTIQLDGDCSGLVYAVFRRAGVKVQSHQLPRETANDYFHRTTGIDQPSKVGDLGFLLRDGHAYHVFMFVGDGVVEAGDGTGKVGFHTVEHENARGAVWGRMDTDIEEGEMATDEIKALIREEVEVIYSTDVADAQKYLEEQGIIGRRHPAQKAASVGYVDLLLSRVLRKLQS